jgi:hypothetical protein
VYHVIKLMFSEKMSKISGRLKSNFMALESLNSKNENDSFHEIAVYLINLRFSETGPKNLTKSLSLFDI